ncbi:efflux RND transporter permease subunit [Kordiimonas laminariae]|uniref:efflux RND transporter permease subunit n=1 Tax=Kordiimonas laminariae TaxID=2917717 RepID=UPI001FF4BA69|nr:efflux RND transporter permease subunit [Kordiimonas laminariae]MCK0068675.1 efflux RND transporter permease subunit [Kordiimonas laminariae]
MKGSLYNHPRVVWLLLLLIVISGTNAFFTMPRLEDPHMESRVIQVTTFYPGADAERVEAEVTEKLERKIREIPEVEKVRSTSRPGNSLITVTLEDRITDAKPITARLRDKVAEVTDLPEGATAPDFSDTRIYAHSAILSLTWHSDSPINYAILGRHAREVESRLRNLSGTDFVDVLGLPQEEIRITVDDSRLAAHGLTMAEVANMIRGSDARGAAGVVAGTENRMVVQVTGAIDNIARIQRIPIGQDAFGASLRIGDVATVTRTFEDPPSRLTYLDGHYGVVVAARMFEDSRIDQWSDQIAALMADIEQTLPASIHLDRIFDQREYADERLDGLMGNLAVGALVVLGVLLVSLGWRASLVSASILPLTLLAALAITNMFGLRIQQVLVTGLIVALGIMVDNAIVITDEIQHLRLQGERRATAVAKTVRKLWVPLLGSTMTTVIAFMPLVLMPGNAGDFLLGVPAAVIASLVASYIIAFTIISAVAGRMLEGRLPDEVLKGPVKRVWWRDGIDGGMLARAFEASLRWSVKRPLRSIVVATAIPLAGFALAGQLTEQFFPVSDRNQFRIQVYMPAQASIEETRKATEFVNGHLKKIEEIESVHWFIGTRPAKFYYSMIAANDGVVSISEAAVTVGTFEQITTLIPRLQEELTKLLPEAMILVRELGSGPPIQAPIELRILGPDLEVLEELGEQARSILAEVPNVTYTRTSLKAGRPMVSVEAREDDVSVTGLSLKQVEQQLQGLTSGIIATYVIEQTQQVPVRLIADRASRMNIESIANMSLMGGERSREIDQSFADLPVSAVADVKLATKVGAVEHWNGERMNKVQAFLRFGILPEDAFKEVQVALAEANLKAPPGYTIQFGGESEERDEAVGQLFGTAGMLVVLMLLAIVLTFNSFRLAFVTLAAAVQAAGLGLFSMWFFNYPLSFVVIFGLMGLVGLAINAAIVILSELRGREDARNGDAEAVVKGVMSTGRHILSTTITTVGGFMPLILAGGPFWPPFAVAIAGGAFLSMVVSFYFAPAAFLFLTRRRRVSAPGELPKPKNPEPILPITQ